MKDIVKYIFILIILTGSLSCEEEVRKHDIGIPPAPVSDVTTESDNGSVILTWKVPQDENYHYTHISYLNSKGVLCGKNISKYSLNPETGYTTDTIKGFGNTEEYAFKLYACSEGGAKSTPVEVKETPLAPIFDLIIETVTCEADFGGIKVNWLNETGREAFIVVRFVIDGKVIKSTIDARKQGEGSGTVSGASKAEPIEFQIVVTDDYENQSKEIKTTLTPIPEIKFPKDTWSIPGYVEGKQDATIGYSSQATNEGDAPNGRAVALLDDDLNTYWHAAWSNPSTSYPHWFIIDLGKIVTISRVEMTRRQDDNGKNCQTGHQYLTSLENTDDKNSENWNWEDQGIYDFNPEDKNPQMYRLEKNPKARYLKVYFPEGYKGANNYAALADINIFGAED